MEQHEMEKCGQEVKAAVKVQTKNHVVLKERIGDLKRVLDGKKSSLRKAYKNQAEAKDKSLVTERKPTSTSGLRQPTGSLRH